MIKRVTHWINCCRVALFTGTLLTINIWYTTMFNIASEKMRFKGGNMYTFKFIYVYPRSNVESENILIYAWMVFPTMHMSLHYDCYDTYL